MAEEKYKVGQRFNSWTLLKKLPRAKAGSRWFVVCDCGLKKETYASNIHSGKSKMCASCGAKKRWREGRGPDLSGNGKK